MPGPRRVLGVVVAPPPASLATRRLGGVHLVDHALAALGDLAGCDVVLVGGTAAGTRCVSPDLPVSQLVSGYDVVLVHDPLCPLVPVGVLGACVDAVAADGAAVGVLPVTDTVKCVDGDVITSTLDRDVLRVLASPVAFATSVSPQLERRLPGAHDLGDLKRLSELLRNLGRLFPVPVPSLARRVDDAGDIAVLECLDGMRHRLHEH